MHVSILNDALAAIPHNLYTIPFTFTFTFTFTFSRSPGLPNMSFGPTRVAIWHAASVATAAHIKATITERNIKQYLLYMLNFKFYVPNNYQKQILFGARQDESGMLCTVFTLYALQILKLYIYILCFNWQQYFCWSICRKLNEKQTHRAFHAYSTFLGGIIK